MTEKINKIVISKMDEIYNLYKESLVNSERSNLLSLIGNCENIILDESLEYLSERLEVLLKRRKTLAPKTEFIYKYESFILPKIKLYNNLDYPTINSELKNLEKIIKQDGSTYQLSEQIKSLKLSLHSIAVSQLYFYFFNQKELGDEERVLSALKSFYLEKFNNSVEYSNFLENVKSYNLVVKQSNLRPNCLIFQDDSCYGHKMPEKHELFLLMSPEENEDWNYFYRYILKSPFFQENYKKIEFECDSINREYNDLIEIINKEIGI